MKFISFAAAAAVSICLFGCGEAKFKIDGEVYGAEGNSIVLEKSDFDGRWVAVDSARVGSNGKFSISSAAPASPEIYRLSLGDKFIYLPVDSVENLSVTSSKADFGHKFTLTGTPQAEKMAAFDSELMNVNASDPAALEEFKKNVYTKYIKDSRGSILGYYVLTKTFDGGRLLYDPADAGDARYYAAVATQFDNYRPDDPHGKMIKEVSLSAMRKRNSSQGKKTVIHASELSVIDIDLPDASGKNVRLSDVVGKGKPVVVVFSMMNEPSSPAFNRQLARIYNAHAGAVQFYQVSFDEGQYEWREAVANLPWINVIDPGATSSTAMRDYNLSALPAVFLYDASGELVDRPQTLSDLEKKL